jgi:hypothetical protein
MEGPNVKKLIAMKVARDAIPNDGGFMDGIKFLLDKEKISTTATRATEWVKRAIQAVRDAKEPNPWKSADDEAIAAEILRQIESKE